MNIYLSGKIHDEEMDHVLDHTQFAKYEITIETPRLDFLQASEQLEQFRTIYRNVITEIREKYGHNCHIHLFPAIPVPIAIACGKELLRGVDPEVIIYQRAQVDRKFTSVLVLK